MENNIFSVLRETYDSMLEFASSGPLEGEINKARSEFVKRTGDIFESDASFERRMGSFLEWYVMDRPVDDVAGNKTPAKLYVESVVPDLTTQQVAMIRSLTRTVLTLAEFRGTKNGSLYLTNLMDGMKIEVSERRGSAGLEKGDLLELRLIPISDEKWILADSLSVHPRPARKVILRASKTFRKAFKKTNLQQDAGALARLDFVHRLAWLANRSERYKHLEPKQIFAEELDSLSFS
ncbi:hypothetical protein KAI87_17315 [Myxococcota bacterium]|nr:hypothetical protein [Myxococcota bacterium]